MNAPAQTYSEIAPERLLEAVNAQRAAGSRLVQICCSRLQHFEILYSFSRPHTIEHLRICIPDSRVALPSISSIYGGSFAYENEIHDLYGITFTGMNVDYQGHFFRTAIPAPMAVPPVCAAPAPKPNKPQPEKEPT